jgi:hypothetical protein
MADLKILAFDSTGSMFAGLQRPPVKIRGMNLLVQVVAMELMRNPGRNIADPTAGAGVRQMIGQNMDEDDESEFFADLRMRMTVAEGNIKARQAKTTRKSDERLARLTLVDIIPIPDQSQVSIVLEVVSEADEIKQTAVSLR